jgi:hypothetical protein
MSNTVNVSTTTNQVVITPQSAKTVSINSGGDTSITVNQGVANTVTISNNIVDTSLTPNTVDITTPPSNGITVTDLSTTVTVNQGTTSVINVNTVGPQGPKGDTGATGPEGPTGSLLITASYANPNLTFTKGNGDTFDVEIIGGTPPTGSLLKTASVDLNTLTFTKGDNSTFDLIVDTGSLEGYATEIYVGQQTASLSSSLAVDISTNVENITTLTNASSSFASDINDLETSSSNALITGSVSLNTLTFTKGNGDTFDLIVDTGSAETVDTGSLLKTASITDATITFTKGDDSTFDIEVDNVTSSISASYVQLAQTASYVENAQSASYVQLAQTASYVEEAQNNFDTISYNNTTFGITAIRTNGGTQTATITNVPSSSYVSSSGNIIADSITLSTSSVQDTYMIGFFRTTDGIAQRSSYFLSFDNNSTALKNSNFGATNFPISASNYYNRVIPCDDMTIADGKSIDITGMLIVSGADNVNSRQVQIDLYTASITPNNATNPSDPLNFTRAFQGNNIALDVASPFNSIHHFTQSFDISTLPTNSLIAVALSNDSAATAVTTDTNVSISLRLTRNYKKKN